MKLLIYEKFFDSLIRLPRNIQKKVIEFQRKFREDPKSAAIHLEPISTFKDHQLRSARIDKAYRAIVRAPESGDVYFLLWVDHHDKAYEWAMNKRFEWNQQTHSVQLFSVPETAQELEKEPVIPENKFLDTIQAEKLLRIGVPEALLPSVIEIKDIDGLEALERYLPSDAFENLFYLLDGAKIDALITEVEAGKSADEAFEDQLSSINNQRSFIEFTEDEIFNEILAGDLKKWKFYLHPSQRRVVEGSFRGPVKVTGGAGTGKTVAALHRLKFLSEKLPSKPILFVTYTKALTQNIKKQAKDLDINKSRYELTNIDSLAFQLAREYSVIANDVKVVGLSKVASSESLWDAVFEGSLVEWDRDFLQSEYRDVILYQNIQSREEYFKALRHGRHKPVSRRQRNQLWSIFEAYNSIKQERRLIERDELYNLLFAYFSKVDKKPFSHIIADELQDLSNVELRFLRSLVEEKKDDLFLTGDPFQKIYHRRLHFTNAGINVRGRRSMRLRINYRTSEEIRESAIKVIDRDYYDNFDGEAEEDKGYRSLFHGNHPQYHIFDTKQKEIDYVMGYIKDCKAKNYPLSDLVFAARERNGLKDFRTRLHKEKVPVYDLLNNTGDPSGVHFSTLHSLKGLEFKHVILVDVNDRTLPMKPMDFDYWDEVRQKEYIKSEKALMYVAMTRAVMNVMITGTGQKSDLIDL